MIKPRKLVSGSTIATVSPSWGGAAIFPGIYQTGVENLRWEFDFNIVEMPTVHMDPDELYANPQLRAKDINDAFANEEIDAIFATIGGIESIRILPYLDLPTILSNPKVLMGYSDTCTLLTYLNWQGLVTFHGPSIMSGWAQMMNFPFLRQHYADALMSDQAGGVIEPFPLWSDGYPDWGDPERWGEVLHLQENTTGFEWIQGSGVARGRLWGGCIEVVDFLKGTDFWPPQNFWDNRVLFFETSEDKPTPLEVGCSIRNLGMQGILDRISGILIARPKEYTEEETVELHETVRSVVADEFGNPDLAIVGRMDFGHTDPNRIMPLGIEVEIDAEQQRIAFTEDFFATG